MTSRSIYIVDDEVVVRTSLHQLMAMSSNTLVQSFASGDAFLASAGALTPGVLLLDIHMPGKSGMEVLSEISDGAKFATIIVTGRGDLQLAIAAMKAGVVDFIEKPYRFDELQASIEIAFSRLERDSQLQIATERAKAKIAGLSPRELEVLVGLVDGKSNKEIALDLAISPRTVEIYRANLMDKLQVSSLSEALRLAFAAGMIEPD